jgi:hypothetical protein
VHSVALTGERPHQPLALRIAVLLHRGELDRELAEGRRPDGDPALALRARQLGSAAVQRRLACALVRIVDVAGCRPRRDAAAPLDRDAVVESRALLLQLAERLVAPEPPNPRGVAMVSHLITDGAGPLYTDGTSPFRREPSPRTLWEECRAAVVAMDRLRPSG